MQTIKNKNFTDNLKKLVSRFIYCLLAFNNCDCDSSNTEKREIYDPGIKLTQDRDFISTEEEEEYKRLCSEFVNKEQGLLTPAERIKNSGINKRLTELNTNRFNKKKAIIAKYPEPTSKIPSDKRCYDKEIIEKIKIPYLKKAIELARINPEFMRSELTDENGNNGKEYSQKELVLYWEQELEKEKKEIYG